MKFLSIFFICSFLISSTYCQNIDKLDKTYGFKIFKFGKEITSIPDIKEHLIYSNKKYYKSYIYTGNDFKTLNGVPIYGIELNFYRNKLFQITLSMGKNNFEYTEINYEIVMTTLVSNFGIQNHPCETMTESLGIFLNCAIWDAKNVSLEHNRISFKDVNTIVGYLIFTEKNIQNQQQIDELN